MREFPHQKALVQRHANEPFAIVGVNTDDDRAEYGQKLVEHGVTWRSAWQGSTRGPLVRAWGVDSFPTVFVLDEEHVVRAINPRGAELERVVDELLAARRAR